ncbi:hypothetical protein [Hymenobacter properus]|uniref:Uncharacterized protein n=1 Tax=Hymenobacter properus TaxID=2791026 RepID=A0A931BF84_9BACT|nr:hypothetical protein [Hymenobacter properus]MBF9141197.1 hypothetical protein [Hymenobacter properus]MBR7720006.1 hypothetical protein [Microvirga sp. SRT04]
METELQAAQPHVPLYSARAIRGFSMLFSAIAGGFLTAQNLRDVGQSEAARKALWGSIGYTLLLLWLTSYLPNRVGGTWLPLVIGYAGAMGLEAYSKKFVPNWIDFPTKSIKKPLLICLAITLPLIAAIVYLAAVASTVSGGLFQY